MNTTSFFKAAETTFTPVAKVVATDEKHLKHLLSVIVHSDVKVDGLTILIGASARSLANAAARYNKFTVEAV
jgi:hypothetical protein